MRCSQRVLQNGDHQAILLSIRRSFADQNPRKRKDLQCVALQRHFDTTSNFLFKTAQTMQSQDDVEKLSAGAGKHGRVQVELRYVCRSDVAPGLWVPEAKSL